MMFTYKCNKALCQANESYTQCTLIDNAFNSVSRSQLVSTYPQTLHQQRELLGKSSLLELETIIKLLGSNLQHIIKLCKETVDTLLLIFDSHAFDGKFYDIDSREREVSTSNRRLCAKTVLKHASSTSHSGNLMHVSLRIICSPVRVLIK